MEGRGDASLPARMARKRERDHPDFGGDNEPVRGDTTGYAETTDSVLALFDLNLRADRMPDEEWVASARARAEQIRLGHEKHILWWHADRRAFPLEHVRLKADTGVHAFQVDRGVCEELRSFLATTSNYNEHGYLMLAGTQFPGYGGYPFVHAPGGHASYAQELRTVRVHSKRNVNAVLRSTPQLWALVVAVRCALMLPTPRKGQQQTAGKSIVALHFLVQDETQQAVFSWHDDGEDLQEISARYGVDHMTSVIMNLSDACSGMRIWGCAPALYRVQGDAVAFPGRALHESLPRSGDAPAECAVFKVALFFN